MRNDLRAQLNAALRDVDWHGEAQVLRIIRQGRERKRVFRGAPLRAFVLALALLLALATAAVALTLHFSGRLDARLLARQAVMEKYGLTEEMLDLFAYTPAEEGTDGTARFAATGEYYEQLGVYTVRRAAAGGLETAWSHDGADAALLTSGSLASSAWGAKQLERILALYRERTANWTTALNPAGLTLEERAALDAPLLEIQEAGMLIHIAPGEGDLSPSEAETIARRTIAERYGVSLEALSAHSARIDFFLYGGANRREYRVDLDGYVVYIVSPSGAVAYCRWMISAKDRTLPAGDLSRYPVAAEEFIASGAFESLEAEEKAAVTRRYKEAGLSALLPRSDYASPQAEDLWEEEARGVAAKALEAAYGLPEGWKALFKSRIALVTQGSRRVWMVEYIPYELENWHWRDFEKLGVYTVALDAEGGDVIACDWSLQDAPAGDYTEHNFAEAPAYDGAMIPWVQALLADLQKILAQYPEQANLSEMSLADRGAYSARMRAAGYSAVQYPDLVPGAQDMLQDEAAALAWDALNALYDLSASSLRRGDFDQEGLIMASLSDGTWMRVWNIVYTDDMDVFTVHVNAETGEIENIWHESPAFGNG